MSTTKKQKPRTAKVCEFPRAKGGRGGTDYVPFEYTGETVTLYEPAKTGRLVPCPGEAHLTGPGRANGNIDNCGLCAPRWGKIEEEAAVDLEDARARRLAVPLAYLSDHQATAISREMPEGARIAEVEEVRKGCRSFFSALVWS